jgi:hypothetical protein
MTGRPLVNAEDDYHLASRPSLQQGPKVGFGVSLARLCANGGPLEVPVSAATLQGGSTVPDVHPFRLSRWGKWLRLAVSVSLFALWAGSDAHGATIYLEDFESGALGAEWTTYSSTASGRVVVTSVLGAPVHGGTYHLAMDQTDAGTSNLNEAVLTLDLSGYAGVSLSFWQKDVNDEDTVLPASFTGHLSGDGVAISADGTTWYTLTSFLGATNIVYTMFAFDLDAAAAAAGITLGSNFMIKFQQFDNFPFTTDGRTFDDILISGNALAEVPEPATLLLLGTGLAAAGVRRRMKKRG